VQDHLGTAEVAGPGTVVVETVEAVLAFVVVLETVAVALGTVEVAFAVVPGIVGAVLETVAVVPGTVVVVDTVED